MWAEGSGLGAFQGPQNWSGFQELRGARAAQPASSLPCASLQRHLVHGTGINTFQNAQVAAGEPELPWLVDGVSAGETLEHSQGLFPSTHQSCVASSDDLKGFPETSSVA